MKLGTPVPTSLSISATRRTAALTIVVCGLLVTGLLLTGGMLLTPAASRAQEPGTSTPPGGADVSHDELMRRMEVMMAQLRDMTAQMNLMTASPTPAAPAAPGSPVDMAALMARMQAMQDRMRQMMSQAADATPASVAGTPVPGSQTDMAALMARMQTMRDRIQQMTTQASAPTPAATPVPIAANPAASDTMTMMQDLIAMMQSMLGDGVITGGMGSGATPTAQAAPGAVAASPGATADPARLVWSAQAGNVTVTARPLTLRTAGVPTLDFEISLQTHSVDLGQDLTQLAAIITATGAEIKPAAWNGPRGGHHVKGVLSFPTKDGVGRPVDGPGDLTLVIRNLAGVPERTFVWNLP